MSKLTCASQNVVITGYLVYVFAVYASCMHAHVHISMTFEPTCVLVLVGVAHAFGLGVHLQQKCEPRIEKNIAKRLLKEFEDLHVWLFLKKAMRFLCFASSCSVLLYSSRSLWTSWGVVAVSSVCLCLRFCFHASLLALPHSHHNFLTMRPLDSQ